MNRSIYSVNYFLHGKDGIIKSAREIVPLILNLAEIKSVIDVGCGLGYWLSIFQEYGINDILGIDGPYLDKSGLVISEDKFKPFDLKQALRINKKFDLVISIEVAECLPAEYAEIYIESLTSLGPLILFSAPIPFQGGELPLNMQWPDYWAEIFAKQGYAVIDCLRKLIWNNRNINFYYRQNILLFAKKEYISQNLALAREYQNTNINMLSLVHPEKYLMVADLKNFPSFKNVLLALPFLFWKSVKGRICNFLKKHNGALS